MGIDLINIQPNVISRDLKGKYVMLYGKPKSGKTTAACSFPKSLLLAFEKGYNAIGGIRAQDINNWTDFKLVLRQLSKKEVKEMYDTIIIDTVSVAWEYVEQFICIRENTQKIIDIPWGAGYAYCKKEFENSLRQITQLGYGVVLIAHSDSRKEKTVDGSEIEIISPSIPKRAAEICNGIVDIIGYIGNEYRDGEVKRWLYTRETPTLFAGSRFKYLEPKIPFGYDELVEALGRAIDMAEKVDHAKVVDHSEGGKVEKLDFNAIREKAKENWSVLVGRDANNAEVILKKIENIMGHRMKLSEFSEDQVDMLNLVLLEMNDML